MSRTPVHAHLPTLAISMVATPDSVMQLVIHIRHCPAHLMPMVYGIVTTSDSAMLRATQVASTPNLLTTALRHPFW